MRPIRVGVVVQIDFVSPRNRCGQIGARPIEPTPHIVLGDIMAAKRDAISDTVQGL